MPRTNRAPRIAGIAAITVLVALLGAACGSSDDSSSTTTTTSAAVEITDAWVRTTPAGATAGAAYMTISSPDGDQLISASVPADVAAVTELHETTEAESDSTMPSDADMGEEMDGSGMGQMTMKQVQSIDVPAGGSVSLEPGGYHVMLIDLAAPLETGQTVPITLTFEKAGTITVEAPVRSA